MMSTILRADSAGPKVQHLYHKSGIALAALVPAGALSPDGSALRMGADMGLALAIPLHSHIAMNYVLTDYVPRGMQGAARFGVLGLTAVTLAGLLKLNLAGMGVTQSVKELWRSDPPPAQQQQQPPAS